MLFKYRLHNQICQTLKHYSTLLNKSLTTLALKRSINITSNGNLRPKVPKNSVRSFAVSIVLILLAVFLATNCGPGEHDHTLATSTLTPALTIPLATQMAPTATVLSRQTSVVNATATAKSTIFIPTATSGPAINLATPLPTTTPTLSLRELLTQTIVVTATNLIVNITLSNTTVVTYPLPPIVVQPLLGPPPTTVQPPPPLPPTPPTELATDNVARSVHLPILMYHYLSTPPATADIYRRDLSVSPALFAAHLDRMRTEGYTTVSLYDLVAHLQQGTPLPEKPVILTFDDGYRDNYENAFPLLRERQMQATFFIVIDFIDRERPEYLTWDMVREMYAGGMSIEVHGVDHTTLRGRSQVDLEFQALRSYETIQDRIGVRPRFLSYPAGEYDQATIEIFRSATYWAGVTTVQGATQSSEKLFELQRIRIRNTTTPDELMRLLQHDW